MYICDGMGVGKIKFGSNKKRFYNKIWINLCDKNRSDKKTPVSQQAKMMCWTERERLRQFANGALRCCQQKEF